MKSAAFAVSLLLGAGCGGGAGHVEPDESSTGTAQQRLSAGFLGCRPGRIEIASRASVSGRLFDGR